MEDGRHDGGSIDHLLEVVEDEKPAFVREEGSELILGTLARRRHVERPQDG